MEWSARDADILQILLENDEPVQSQEIADRLGISARTIQRTLPFLSDAVTRYGMMMVRSRSKGNRLTGTPTARERLMDSLPQNTDIDPGDRAKRQRYLLFALLKEREPRKIFYYSDLLGVSETTIAADIESLAPWLEKNNLTVVKKKGYGVFLSGSEQDYREAMRRFIEENNIRDTESHRHYGDDALSQALISNADSGMFSFLDKDVINRVNLTLDEMDESRLRSLAENAYAGLVIHISIAIERIRQGGAIEISPERMDGLEEWEEYDLAVRIIEAMEDEFEIEIPREEVSYILLHIQGSKLAYSSDIAYTDATEVGEVGDEELLELIDRMIDAYDPHLAVRLKSDEDFVRGLIVHLRPVFVRLKGHMNIYNPMLSDIKKEYPDIFSRCRVAAACIEDMAGMPVGDEEVGFLAMHFGAAQERLIASGEPPVKVSIGIVCASGFGVARLMMTRLEKYLSDKAYLTAYGRDELNRRSGGEVDFFVSTMNLDQYGVDYLLVSPLITGSDLALIEQKMLDYGHLRKAMANVDFLTSLERIAFVTDEIRSVLENYKAYKVAANITFRELLLFLGLKITGNATKANRIVEAVNEREKLYTQLFPEMGFGLLHCRSEAVDTAVFVTASPKGGDLFSDPYFKDIRAVVMMISPIDEHRGEHAKVLGALSAAFIERESFLKAIIEGDEVLIRSELTDVLKNFYQGFLRETE